MSTSSRWIIETERTGLRLPTKEDGPFFLELLNDPEFIRMTGDRGIRDLKGAEGYVTDRLLAQHEKHGFALYVVEERATGTATGICGLVQRDYLDAPDVGYGFLPAFRNRGIGSETARAVLDFARDHLNLAVVYGITRCDNSASSRLLERIGLEYVTTQEFPQIEDPQKLYRISLR